MHPLQGEYTEFSIEGSLQLASMGKPAETLSWSQPSALACT